jgi:hypothetical protein
MVVAKVTIATASNITDTIHTTGTYTPSNGYSLSEIREGTDSAAGYNLNENFRKIGGRSAVLAGIHPRQGHNNTTQWANDTTVPTQAPRNQGTPKWKRTKATLRIASLNMRGRGIEKWHYTV